MNMCGNEEIFAAYLDRSLSPAQKEIFERHLSSCSRCLGELIAISDEMEGMKREPAASGDRLREGRFSTSGRRSLVSEKRIFKPAAAAASFLGAAILVAAIAVFSTILSRDHALKGAGESVAGILDSSFIGELRLSRGRSGPESAVSATRGSGPSALDPGGRTRNILMDLRARYPDNMEIARLIGDYYMAMNNPAMAEVYFRQAAEKSGDPPSLNDLAVSLYRQGKTDAALAQLEKSVVSAMPCEECLYNLAVINHGLGETGRSSAFARRYLLLDRDSAWASRLIEICGE